MSLLQYPASGTIYARNTVPDIIISTTESVHVVVWFKAPEDGGWEPDNIMIDASYIPDFNGLVTLNFDELYKAYAKTLFPITGNSLYQEYYHYLFAATITGLTSDTQLTADWRVANAELHSSTPFNSWADEHFLTNQPAEKRTNKDAPEFLTYLDDVHGNRILKAWFYPLSGGKESVNVYTSPEQGCYTVNVSFSRLIQLSSYMPGQLNGYYDVVVCDDKGGEHQKQRYIFSERTGREKYFLFINSLGGIDTLICDGENVLAPEITLNVGRFNHEYIALGDTDNIRQWMQQTGLMPYKHRDWLHELLTSRQGAWKYDNSYQPIVLKTAEIAMSDNGQLAGASFYYIESVESSHDRDETCHQSVADQAEALDDLTTQAVMEFAASQGGGYETEAITVNSDHIYVTVGGTSTVYVLIDGQVVTEIDPTSRMPVVVEVNSGAEISFDCQDNPGIVTVNFYPDENYSASHHESAQQQTES